MRKFLLDTCVISEMMKDHPEPSVMNWLKKYDSGLLYMSVMSLGELKQGLHLLSTSSEKKKKLTAWLDGDVRSFFQERVLSVSSEVAEMWGVMMAEGRKILENPPPVDLLLAATARVHGLEMATRNVKDFKIIDVPLFNPWKDSI